ncbi:hypothetical protein AB5I83_07690 [Mesobacillus sp. LC4]
MPKIAKKDPGPSRTIRERMSDVLYNLTFIIPIAIFAFLISWIYLGGGGGFLVEKGWNPIIFSGFNVLIDLLLIGLNLILGIFSLKTLWFLYREGKAGRSYFTLLTDSKYNKVFETAIIIVLLGGSGTLFIILAVSRLMAILI